MYIVLRGGIFNYHQRGGIFNYDVNHGKIINFLKLKIPDNSLGVPQSSPCSTPVHPSGWILNSLKLLSLIRLGLITLIKFYHLVFVIIFLRTCFRLQHSIQVCHFFLYIGLMRYNCQEQKEIKHFYDYFFNSSSH